jgi:hypothetical protein
VKHWQLHEGVVLVNMIAGHAISMNLGNPGTCYVYNDAADRGAALNTAQTFFGLL